jgi:hypothetical protein
MFIDFTNIGLSGVHISTMDYEEMFIVNSTYLNQIIVMNMN